jgi:hypothetical protein
LYRRRIRDNLVEKSFLTNFAWYWKYFIEAGDTKSHRLCKELVVHFVPVFCCDVAIFTGKACYRGYFAYGILFDLLIKSLRHCGFEKCEIILGKLDWVMKCTTEVIVLWVLAWTDSSLDYRHKNVVTVLSFQCFLRLNILYNENFSQ